MVHALELVRDLLRPGGKLLDLHPTGEPPIIGFVTSSRRTELGRLQETDGFIEYAQANHALAHALEAGWFKVERQGEFIFTVQADNIASLSQFLSENWKDSLLMPQIVEWAEQLAPLHSGSHIELSERVQITRFRLPGRIS